MATSDSILSNGTTSSSRANLLSSPPGSSSRPFLNLLNPLGRDYRGYQHPQDSVMEEEEEREDDENDDDREEGPSHGRRVSWLQSSAADQRIRMHDVHRQDSLEEEDEDDDEVPQSLMIETQTARSTHTTRLPKLSPRRAPPPPTSSSARFASRYKHPGPGLKSSISMPPRPSDLHSGNDFQLPPPNTTQTHTTPMRGLDAYERALWNWVNVYNLDAYLQEVCLLLCDVILEIRSMMQLHPRDRCMLTILGKEYIASPCPEV